MKINCLIIDDEPLARKRLYNLVSKNEHLNYIGEAKTGKEAIESIQKLTPDLIFLDIQMKDMNGFDVLQKVTVEKMPIIIFVTAFDTYALKAFDYFALDYLLKPFKKERFEKSIEKVLESIGNKKSVELKESLENLVKHFNLSQKKETSIIQKLPIKTGKTVSFIDINNIKYITASGSYIDIKTNHKTHVLRTSLSDVLKDINNQKFRRIHRSTIINIDCIKKIIHSNFGEIDVEMDDNSQFRISNSYKNEFLKAVGLK